MWQGVYLPWQTLLQQGHLSTCFMFPVSSQWPIDGEPPKHKDVGPLTFGLLFLPEFATSTLEKGPQADRPEVRGVLPVWGSGGWGALVVLGMPCVMLGAYYGQTVMGQG